MLALRNSCTVMFLSIFLPPFYVMCWFTRINHVHVQYTTNKTFCFPFCVRLPVWPEEKAAAAILSHFPTDLAASGSIGRWKLERGLTAAGRQTGGKCFGPGRSGRLSWCREALVSLVFAVGQEVITATH